jgi:hypothetical protein
MRTVGPGTGLQAWQYGSTPVTAPKLTATHVLAHRGRDLPTLNGSSPFRWDANAGSILLTASTVGFSGERTAWQHTPLRPTHAASSSRSSWCFLAAMVAETVGETYCIDMGGGSRTASIFPLHER